MARRHRDWIDQGICDLRLAKSARASGSFEWACFASQQAAEKALKGLAAFFGGDAWGHSLTKLLHDLETLVNVERPATPPTIRAAARRLDRFYIPTRDPNGFDAGKPADYFVQDDADAAIDDAQHLRDWVDEQVR